MRFIAMIAAALAGSGAVLAQAPAAKEAFKYTSPAEVDKVMQDHRNGQATSSIARYADFSGFEVDRIASGRVETHDKWTDFIRVLDGRATLTIGGAVAGKVANGAPANGEWYGDSSSGGQVYDMVAGATFVIPAGTPHWMQVPAGGHVHYLAFKHPAP